MAEKRIYHNLASNRKNLQTAPHTSILSKFNFITSNQIGLNDVEKGVTELRTPDRNERRVKKQSGNQVTDTSSSIYGLKYGQYDFQKQLLDAKSAFKVIKQDETPFSFNSNQIETTLTRSPKQNKKEANHSVISATNTQTDGEKYFSERAVSFKPKISDFSTSKPGTAGAPLSRFVRTPAEGERITRTAASMRANKNEYFRPNTEDKPEAVSSLGKKRLSQTYTTAQISQGKKVLNEVKKDHIERLTNYYRSRSFIDSTKYPIMTRQRLTSPNYENDMVRKKILSEIHRQDALRVVPETNERLKEKGLKRELYDSIIEDKDGLKILGGDNKTIVRWWQAKKALINGDISLSSNLLSQKRKTFVRFLCQVGQTANSIKTEQPSLDSTINDIDQKESLRIGQQKFVTLAVDRLSEQVQYLIATDRNANKKDENGILIKPDKLLKGVVRCDKLIDDLCYETIKEECTHLRNSELKNSYVIKGKGKGRGTQLSHPRMDFLCLKMKQTNKIKFRSSQQAQEVEQTGKSKLQTPFEYFQFEHFQKYGDDAMKEMQNDQAMNAILSNKFK